ncbi:MAG: EAL domain-containing protein [Lachnospiraceae bacterium]|nr:EAL domain-containing protein [Lachnospiraceae bacterium]
MEKDYLTNLPNRKSLYQYYLALPQDSSIHAMFIDIDNYKKVNDIHGHNMGDQLLVCIADFLRQEIKDGFSARLGGDEFVVLLDGKIPSEEVPARAEALLKNFKEMNFRADVLSLVSLSVGIIQDQCVTTSLDEILTKCDDAMYQAKCNGKNRYMLCSELDSVFEINRKIEAEMEAALENGEFCVFFQPKLNVVTSQLYGAEALSRWIHPEEGIRVPKMYIELFEKNGFITRLDMYIFEEVCRMKASWEGKRYRHIPVSVNMSRLHLYDRGFPDRLEAIAQSYGIATSELEIELTEKTFVKDSEELILAVEMLKKKGFLVSIDNFGAGFSALYLLKDLAADTIKIGKDFLQSSCSDVKGKRVLRNIITMCKNLNMDVVTEGVETKDQVNFIISCGCQIAQGFFYAKPLPPKEFFYFAEEYMGQTQGNYMFRLNGNLCSEDGGLEGSIAGEGLTYEQGIFSDSYSLYFPGGPKEENVVLLPPEVIINDSYSVSMWIHPKVTQEWSSALYIKFESGFTGIVPHAFDGSSVCRIRDSRNVTGWYDITGCQLAENVWFHYVMTYNARTKTAMVFINGEATGRLENIPVNHFVNRVMLGGDIFQPSFHGHICEVVFYNEVKDYDFIKKLHRWYTEKDNFIAF